MVDNANRTPSMIETTKSVKYSVFYVILEFPFTVTSNSICYLAPGRARDTITERVDKVEYTVIISSRHQPRPVRESGLSRCVSKNPQNTPSVGYNLLGLPRSEMKSPENCSIVT